MKAIKSILIGLSSEVSLNVKLTSEDIFKIAYCPMILVKIEKSFSRYETVLRPNQRSFEIEYLKVHIIIINCIIILS